MDRRIEKTRQLIMTTFMDLVREKGFEKTTIRDISERADINRGTVYLHFVDKYDILEKCIDKYLEELTIHCKNEPQIKLKKDALPGMFSYMEENKELYSLLYKNDKAGIFRSKLHEIISAQIDAAFTKFPKEMVASKDITTEFLSNGFLGVTEWWLRESFPYTSEEMAAHLFTLFKPYTKFLN